MEGGRNNVRHHLVVEKHFSQRLAPRFESEATLTLKEVADRVQLPADLTAKRLALWVSARGGHVWVQLRQVEKPFAE